MTMHDIPPSHWVVIVGLALAAWAVVGLIGYALYRVIVS